MTTSSLSLSIYLCNLSTRFFSVFVSFLTVTRYDILGIHLLGVFLRRFYYASLSKCRFNCGSWLTILLRGTASSGHFHTASYHVLDWRCGRLWVAGERNSL